MQVDPFMSVPDTDHQSHEQNKHSEVKCSICSAGKCRNKAVANTSDEKAAV